jgi:hypothetical protein
LYYLIIICITFTIQLKRHLIFINNCID